MTPTLAAALLVFPLVLCIVLSFSPGDPRVRLGGRIGTLLLGPVWVVLTALQVAVKRSDLNERRLDFPDLSGCDCERIVYVNATCCPCSATPWCEPNGGYR